jgi:hypothetical protein
MAGNSSLPKLCGRQNSSQASLAYGILCNVNALVILDLTETSRLGHIHKLPRSPQTERNKFSAIK